MSDTLALVRLMLVRQRTSLILIVAIALIGLVFALAVSSLGTASAEGVAILTLVITMSPAFIWTLVLFTSHGDNPSMESESCFNPWLLRMPIAAWKLALVPVALKTVWIFALWMAFALSARYITGERVPLLNPAFAFSAACIWVLVLTWRPFVNGWWRFGAFLICGLALLACTVGAFADDNDITREPWARFLFLAGIYVMYGWAVWMSLRAVRLARPNSHGLVSERRWLSKSDVTAEVRVRHFSRPRRALLWHDLCKSRTLLRCLFFIGVIPGTLFLILLVPFSLPGYIGTVVLLSYLGFIGSIHVVDKTNKGVVVLPPHIGASPFSTAEIAWSRLFTHCALIVVPLTFSLIVFAGWTLWPQNRATWIQWASEMSEQTGSASAGLRIAIAVHLGTCVLLVSRAATFVWPALCGRSWIQFAIGISMSVGYFLPLIIGIAWFLQQESWEGAEASALYWATFLPPVVLFLLIAKTVGVAVASQQLWSRRLVTQRGIGLAIVSWLALTGCVAIAMSLLIPYPQATLLWCFAAAALIIPLLRVLILPISLQFGRHL